MQASFGSAHRLRRVHFRSCGAVMAANGAADSGRGGRAVLWFRNDLRVHDNAIVAEAARRAKAGQINEVCSCHGRIGDPCCRVLLFDARRPTLFWTQSAAQSSVCVPTGCAAGGAGVLLRPAAVYRDALGALQVWPVRRAVPPRVGTASSCANLRCIRSTLRRRHSVPGLTNLLVTPAYLLL
jgi:hypothetical protein